MCSHAGALGDFGTVMSDLGLAAGAVAFTTGAGEMAAGAMGADTLAGVSVESLGTASTYAGGVSTAADAPECVGHFSVQNCTGFFAGALGTGLGAGAGDVDWADLTALQGLLKSLSVAMGAGTVTWDGSLKLRERDC